MINNYHELIKLKSEFESNYVPNFTFETEINKEVPFLDALVTRTKESVYIKHQFIQTLVNVTTVIVYVQCDTKQVL